MSSSINSARAITPDKPLLNASPRMAKADLRESAAASELSGLIKSTARRVHGKQATAASMVGKAESNFSRDVDAGALRTGELAQLGPEFLAEFGRELVNSYGALQTPAARMRELSRRQREIADELAQLSEYVA